MRWLNRMEEICCVSALLAASALIFVNVLMRYLFRSGLNWSEELIRYLFVVVTFLGLSLGVRKKARISIDILELSLKSDLAKKNLELLINIVQLIFAGVVMVISFYYSRFIFSTRQVSSALELPMFYLYLFIAFGFLSLSISTAKEVFSIFNNRGIQ
mgnify:CR=1 FL=1